MMLEQIQTLTQQQHLGRGWSAEDNRRSADALHPPPHADGQAQANLGVYLRNLGAG